MFTLLLVVHVMVCFFMIFIVLIQSGKGAELGAAFGGSGQTLFGARGAATILSKMTTGAAILFMLTSLTLAVATSKGGSVIKAVPTRTDSSAQQKNIPMNPIGNGPMQTTLPAVPAK